MTRRHILAAPIAALLGSTAWTSTRDIRYSPRATMGDILGGQFFPKCDPGKWPPILDAIVILPRHYTPATTEEALAWFDKITAMGDAA